MGEVKYNLGLNLLSQNFKIQYEFYCFNGNL